MEKSSKTTIRLLGIDYSVIYDDSEERMQRIGFYVDKHFNEVKLRNSKLSTTMIATLSAVNIADDYFKQKEENDILASLKTEIETYCDEMIAKFINGKEPMENFDKFVEKLHQIGVDQYISIHQDAYNRY